MGDIMEQAQGRAGLYHVSEDRESEDLSPADFETEAGRVWQSFYNRPVGELELTVARNILEDVASKPGFRMTRKSAEELAVEVHNKITLSEMLAGARDKHPAPESIGDFLEAAQKKAGLYR